MDMDMVQARPGYVALLFIGVPVLLMAGLVFSLVVKEVVAGVVRGVAGV